LKKILLNENFCKRVLIVVRRRNLGNEKHMKRRLDRKSNVKLRRNNLEEGKS